MSRKKDTKKKGRFEAPLKRSEFDDEVQRNNIRSVNRLKRQINIHDRAHRVIMKSLGKESDLLQTQLENDKKVISFSLYGYKFGTTSPRCPRKNPFTSPIGKIPAKLSTQKISSSNADKKFPWDNDPTDVESTVGKESVLSNKSPTNKSKNSARIKELFARYPSSRVQSDDFISTLLNDALNDEIIYTKSPERRSASVLSQDERKPSRRRKEKTPLQRSSSAANVIVNVLNV